MKQAANERCLQFVGPGMQIFEVKNLSSIIFMPQPIQYLFLNIFFSIPYQSLRSPQNWCTACWQNGVRYRHESIGVHWLFGDIPSVQSFSYIRFVHLLMRILINPRKLKVSIHSLNGQVKWHQYLLCPLGGSLTRVSHCANSFLVQNMV